MRAFAADNTRVISERRRGRAIPAAVTEVLHGSGSPLPAQERASMEARLGHSFAHVRVHADDQAALSAEALGADAYAFGPHVVFGRGRFRPGDSGGSALIAHELAHVAQQSSHDAEPLGVAPADAPAEQHAAAVAMGRGKTVNSIAASPSLIHRQPAATPPAPTTVPAPATSTGAPAADSAGPAPWNADLRTRVRAWLDLEQFDLPIVADADAVNSGARRVFYGGSPQTLDQVTDETWKALEQQTEAHGDVTSRQIKEPIIPRGDVWSQIWQYYNEKLLDAEKARWTWVVQMLYTPQYNLKSTQPGFKPGPQQSLQLSAGPNLRFHQSGHSGAELQLAGNVSLLNFDSKTRELLQNAVASAQLQYVWNLGHEFNLSGSWANLQASTFAQIAAGLGNNYFDDPKSGEHQVKMGFLVQSSGGGQVNLNVAWFQVIVSGSVVYSHLSEQAGAGQPKNIGGLGVQGGIGVGGQF